jgi:hypothetical protein
MRFVDASIGRSRCGKQFADGIIPVLLCTTPKICCGEMLFPGVMTRYESNQRNRGHHHD